MKPALEPITVARKPLDGTVAENVLAHGTGALNVDGCRVAVDPADPVNSAIYHAKPSVAYGKFASKENGEARSMAPPPLGRWPANLIHDGSEEVVGLFPETGPSSGSPRNNGEFKSVAKGRDLPHVTHGHDDAGGSAARFFYCAKASKADRDAGCEGLEKRMMDTDGDGRNQAGFNSEDRPPMLPRSNHHPTVKPTDLMRYLCRLVTPPGGVVLDPFTGSGSTGRGAILEGFRFIGIEREADYLTIARARIDDAVAMRARETAQLTML